MASIILLTALCELAAAGGQALATIGHHDLLMLQDRIVLKRGEGGGVSVRSDRPDPGPSSSAYNHSSRPLFGSQTANAARHSSRRYTPATPPLISSRQVARESVYRSVYGSRWRW